MTERNNLLHKNRELEAEVTRLKSARAELKLEMIEACRVVAELRTQVKQMAEALRLVCDHDAEEDSSGNFVIRFNCEEWMEIERARALAGVSQTKKVDKHE